MTISTICNGSDPFVHGITDFVRADKPPAITGVYFLCKADEVVYVGQSLNIFSRVAQHAAENIKQFDSFYALACHQRDLNQLELRYIKTFQPRHNVVGKRT